MQRCEIHSSSNCMNFLLSLREGGVDEEVGDGGVWVD